MTAAGDKWRFYTDDHDQLVKHLIALAKRAGFTLTLTSLNTYGASLEDAFVEFIKRGHVDHRQVAEQFRGIALIAEKDMCIYYTKPPVLMFGFLFTMFIFLAFFFGRGADVHACSRGFRRCSL